MRRDASRAVTGAVALLCATGALGLAHSQSGNYSTPYQTSPYQSSPYQTGTNTTSNGSGRGSANPNNTRSMMGDFPSSDPNFSHRQLIARREDLKKHMIENAARLLMLTRDLQTELQTREPTEADGKRLDEIAKLARTVRDQMRQ